MKALLAITIAFVFPGVAMAADCPPRTVDETKPVLSGQVEDQSNNLGLRWRSSAGNTQSGGWWSVDNEVCNTGQVPLIVNWPKAQLGNDAYSPLLPGKEMHNGFSIGPTEPQAGAAALNYGGYVARTAQTQIYQAPESSTKTGGLLRSSLGATFARYDYKNVMDAAEIAKAPVETIELQIEITPLKGSYRFSVLSKDASAANMTIAISSQQNENFVIALKKAGIPNPGAFPLVKLIRNVPKESAFARFGDVAFVSMPLTINQKPIELFIPAKLDQVELATVVLLREDRPVMLGKVSLYQ